MARFSRDSTACYLNKVSLGPVFYHGRDGREFQILKFHSTYVRPESDQGAKITGRGDPRVTPASWRS